MKDQINLEWKTFKIDLISLEDFLRLNYTMYVGNQAHSQLELYFSEVLSDTDKQSIIDHYTNLVESEEIAKLALGSRKSFDIKNAKLLELKKLMIGKDRTTYSNIEQKIDMGIELDNFDWDILL